MVSGWKQAAIKNVAPAFDKNAGSVAQDSAAESDKLQSRTGQLVVERDISKLNRFSKQSGGGLPGEGLRSPSKERRQMCIEKQHPRLSVRRQGKRLSLTRAGFYHHPVGESAGNFQHRSGLTVYL